MVTVVKAHGGDRAKNLNDIAETIDNMLPTTGAAVTLRADQVHILKGLVEQIGIISDEMSGLRPSHPEEEDADRFDFANQ
jgi:hypothetical protein